MPELPPDRGQGEPSFFTEDKSRARLGLALRQHKNTEGQSVHGMRVHQLVRLQGQHERVCTVDSHEGGQVLWVGTATHTCSSSSSSCSGGGA